jgi:aminoglycoside phosphotransferase (APT) family kinase protein
MVSGMSGDRFARPPAAALEWAGGVTGRRVVSAAAMSGGMSTATHRLLLEGGDSIVMRRFVNRPWVQRDPYLAAREAAVLRHLESTAVPAPPLIGVDPSGERCGAPAVLMGLMPGRRRAPADARSLGQLARALAEIHDCPPVSGLPNATDLLLRAFQEGLPIRPEDEAPPSPVLWSLVRERRAAAELGAPALIHNDFSHSNVLFARGRLSAVIDWGEAAAGQAACDVSFCRVNLTLTLGSEPADLLLAAYEAEIGGSVPGRAWWDLVAAARVEPDLGTWAASANYLGPPGLSAIQVRRRFTEFVDAAVAATS